MFEVEVGMKPFLFMETWAAKVPCKQSLKTLQMSKDPALSYDWSGWRSLKFDYWGAEVESDPPGEGPRLTHDHNRCVLLVISVDKQRTDLLFRCSRRHFHPLY